MALAVATTQVRPVKAAAWADTEAMAVAWADTESMALAKATV